MLTQKEEYKRRLNKYRKSVLPLQLLIMSLGIVIFALGVVSRPILRIVKPDYKATVRGTLDVMIFTGILQFGSGSLDVFASFSKSMWPVYLGIAFTSINIFLELGSLGANFVLYARSLIVVNEEIVHPWYWVECLKTNTSCHTRMLSYIHWFVLPQIVICVVTVILQCLTVTMLGRLVKIIVERKRVKHAAGERYHNEWQEDRFKSKQRKELAKLEKQLAEEAEEDQDFNNPFEEDFDQSLKTPRRVQFSPGDKTPETGSARKRRGGGGGLDAFEMSLRGPFEADIHAVVEMPTPRSILKGDHGYVAGSRISLDFEIQDDHI